MILELPRRRGKKITPFFKKEAQGDQAEIEYVLTPIDSTLGKEMALYDSWCMGLKVWWAAAVDLAHLF